LAVPKPELPLVRIVNSGVVEEPTAKPTVSPACGLTASLANGVEDATPTSDAKYALPVVVAAPETVSPCVPLPIVDDAFTRMPSVVVGAR
jgi:hypothetical protein